MRATPELMVAIGDGEDGNGMPLSYVYGKDPDRISVSQLKLTVDEA